MCCAHTEQPRGARRSASWDRHGAAVAEATLARAAATRDDLLAQILGWADPAYTGDAMARHAVGAPRR